MRANTGEEDVVLREFRTRELRAKELDVLSRGPNEAYCLQVMHRFVFRFESFHKVYLLLQDLRLGVHHRHYLRRDGIQKKHLHAWVQLRQGHHGVGGAEKDGRDMLIQLPRSGQSLRTRVARRSTHQSVSIRNTILPSLTWNFGIGYYLIDVEAHRCGQVHGHGVEVVGATA